MLALILLLGGGGGVSFPQAAERSGIGVYGRKMVKSLTPAVAAALFFDGGAADVDVDDRVCVALEAGVVVLVGDAVVIGASVVGNAVATVGNKVAKVVIQGAVAVGHTVAVPVLAALSKDFSALLPRCTRGKSLPGERSREFPQSSAQVPTIPGLFISGY